MNLLLEKYISMNGKLYEYSENEDRWKETKKNLSFGERQTLINKKNVENGLIQLPNIIIYKKINKHFNLNSCKFEKNTRTDLICEFGDTVLIEKEKAKKLFFKEKASIVKQTDSTSFELIWDIIMTVMDKKSPRKHFLLMEGEEYIYKLIKLTFPDMSGELTFGDNAHKYLIHGETPTKRRPLFYIGKCYTIEEAKLIKSQFLRYKNTPHIILMSDSTSKKISPQLYMFEKSGSKIDGSLFIHYGNFRDMILSIVPHVLIKRRQYII